MADTVRDTPSNSTLHIWRKFPLMFDSSSQSKKLPSGQYNKREPRLGGGGV